MKSTTTFLALLAALALGSAAPAAPLVLSDFSNFSVDYYAYTGSGEWSNNTAAIGSSTFTIADFGNGAPTSANGNGFIQWLGDTPQDWSSYAFVNLTGATFAGNAADAFDFYIEASDGSKALTTITFDHFSPTLSTASFALNLNGLTSTNVTNWGFVTTDFAVPAPTVGFTFDHVSVSTSAIPEPSTYAAIFGGVVVAFALLRRLRAKRPL
jgi:hypothetical protein